MSNPSKISTFEGYDTHLITDDIFEESEQYRPGLVYVILILDMYVVCYTRKLKYLFTVPTSTHFHF